MRRHVPFLVGLIALLAACGSSASGNDVAPKTYTNTSYGFSVSYDATTFRLVNFRPAPRPFTLDILLEAREQTVPIIGSSDRFVEIQAVKSSDARGILLDQLRTFRRDDWELRHTVFANQKGYGDDSIDGPFHSRDVLFVHNDIYYRITATCPSADWPMDGQDLLAIVGSFSFTN